MASERASYYGADDRLAAVDLRTPGKRLLEEYRSDALGRRVWVSTRWRCASSSDFGCVANAVQRTVWDGASEVAELRARYDTSDASKEEIDAGAPLVLQSIVGDANPFYGRVVYGPALTLDQPLSVTRYEYRDNPSGNTAQAWPTVTLVPFWDYRGTPAFGVFSDGAAWKPFGAGATACAPLGTGTTTRCVSLTWPFAGSAYAQDRGLVLTFSWHGSLLLKRREASGLTYLRNRMYDPSTGRFTQEDPIGLAGGLNAYGFAGGDPVNYADPFGLCTFGTDCWQAFVNAIRPYFQAQTWSDGRSILLESGALGAARGLAAGGGAAVAGRASAATENVQRWMSRAELENTKSTGLLRGGRDGIHFVTDAANSSAQRARLRTSLPKTPEVLVTLEVPAGLFSAPSKVLPDFGMPGGGMERTAVGQVPVTILRVGGKP